AADCASLSRGSPKGWCSACSSACWAYSPCGSSADGAPGAGGHRKKPGHQCQAQPAVPLTGLPSLVRAITVPSVPAAKVQDGAGEPASPVVGESLAATEGPKSTRPQERPSGVSTSIEQPDGLGGAPPNAAYPVLPLIGRRSIPGR